MNRIKRIHLLILAVILFAGLAVAFMMVMVKPRQQTIADLEKKISDEQKVANQRPEVEAALADARSQRSQAEAKWALIMRTKMSKISLADPYRAMFAMYKEIPTYAPQMRAAFNKDKRVQLTSSFGFSQYGFSPPPKTLRGRQYPQNLKFRSPSFPDLLSWLQDTESLPRILSLGGNISITQTSNGINVTIPGTIHIHFAELATTSQPTTSVTGPAPSTKTTGTPKPSSSPAPGSRPGRLDRRMSR